MISDDYLKYPKRRYGMDHDRYDWSELSKRKPIHWPGGARVALWVTVSLQWFPLDQQGKPFKPLGSLQTAYPDLRHYTLRDYGNRVGIFRIMKALEKHGIRPSAPVNAAVAARYPSLVKEIAAKGWELVGHGLDMDRLHYEGMPDEAAAISRSLEILGKFGKVRGWLSPAKSESHQTLDLLAKTGVDYVCDWVNDDMPYAFRTRTRPLVALPHSSEISDRQILVDYRQSEDDFTQQVVDQFDFLHREAGREGGRIMAITLHPWVTGQPHRIGALERALKHIASAPGVWSASGDEIVHAWRAAQPAA